MHRKHQMKGGGYRLSVLPLFLAAASAFVPLQLCPLRSGHVASAGRRPTCGHTRAAWCAKLRIMATAVGGSDSMPELLKAAAATREQLQASGTTRDAGALTLAGLVGDKDTTDCVAGLQALRAVLAEEYGADVQDDVYAAPEPAFKMLPKSANRTAQRVASFPPAAPMQVGDLQQVAARGVGLADFSHSGIIAVTGDDRYRFVNGLCTSKVLDAKPGQAMASCFTTKTGRSVDLTTIAVLDDSILILCSAGRLQRLYQTLDALIFPKDNVAIQDLSLALARFQLVGPQAASVLSTTPCSASTAALPAPFQAAAWGNAGLVIHISGLASSGYTVLVPVSRAVAAWKHLALGVTELDSAAARLLGGRDWEVLRVLEGVPAPDKELTLDHNPLEAALYHTVSFDKGCYVGQETIARLHTYGGLKQQLWGVIFAKETGATAVSASALLEAKMFVTQTAGAFDREEAADGVSGGGRTDGRITSVMELEGDGGEVRCLGYVRIKSGAAAGTVVTVIGAGLPDEGITGQLCDIPYATRAVTLCLCAYLCTELRARAHVRERGSEGGRSERARERDSERFPTL